MRVAALLVIAMALPLSAGDLENFTDNSMNYTQRNSACLALRGNKRPEVVAAMRSALDNASLQACAAANLRLASADAELLDALQHDQNPAARAAAARELGEMRQQEYLTALRKAADDRDPLVSSNAVEGLLRYDDHSSTPQLREIALVGGMASTLAINILIDWHDAEVASIGRKLMAHANPGDQMAGIRAVGLAGDASDLPRLREFQKNETAMGPGSRGFGLMPAISLSRAANTAIQNLEKRLKLPPGAPSASAARSPQFSAAGTNQ
jgi:HEAT repeat protein